MAPKAEAAGVEPMDPAQGFIPDMAVPVQHRHQAELKFVWKNCLSSPCAHKNKAGMSWQGEGIQKFHKLSHHFAVTQCLDGP